MFTYKDGDTYYNQPNLLANVIIPVPNGELSVSENKLSIDHIYVLLVPNELADSLSPEQIKRSRIGALPFELYIHKTGGKLHSKLHSLYGMRYRSESNYSTLIYLGAEYHINKSLTTGSILSYGGYSKFQFGAHLRIKKEKFILGMNTNNLLGWVSKNGNGLGINLSACYILK